MPVPSFQFSGLMDGIGISGLEDPMQSSVPTTHSSEITENTDIQWCLCCHWEGSNVQHLEDAENSYVDWIMKLEKFYFVSITNHREASFTFSLVQSITRQTKYSPKPYAQNTPENHRILKLCLAYVCINTILKYQAWNSDHLLNIYSLKGI